VDSISRCAEPLFSGAYRVGGAANPAESSVTNLCVYVPSRMRDCASVWVLVTW